MVWYAWDSVRIVYRNTIKQNEKKYTIIWWEYIWESVLHRLFVCGNYYGMPSNKIEGV